MNNFESLQAIGQRLKEITDHLVNGKSSQEELEELEVLSRALYERALILHYKAKEKMVKGTPAPLKKENQPAPEVKKQTPPVQEETEEVKYPKTRSSAVEFDFTEGFDTEAPEKRKENTTEEPSRPTPIQEEKTAQKAPDNEAIQSIFNQFLTSFNEASKDRMSTSKINSLPAAIGLNDKLLFINKLFGGNTGLYNETVTVLDQLDGMENAVLKLSEIAVRENWDIEIAPVNAFAHLINRRYVE